MIITKTAFAPLIFFLCIGSTIFAANYAIAKDSTPSITESNAKETRLKDINIADHFFALLVISDPIKTSKIFSLIEDTWSIEYLPMAIETLGFVQSDLVHSRLETLIDNATPKN